MPAPRIMYIENKSARPRGRSGLVGPARIGRVSFSKTGKSLYYGCKTFQSLKGSGKKANYFDVDTREEYCDDHSQTAREEASKGHVG
jgi:hypothetical protein